MSQDTLDHIRHLVEQLSPQDQARLLASLALRMPHLVPPSAHPSSMSLEEANSIFLIHSALGIPWPGNTTFPPQGTVTAWDELFRLGETLAAGDTPESDTMTAALLAMRR